jgi:leucyl aminopeptidase
MKLSVSPKPLTDAPKKYCRLVLTEEPSSHHRLVETADGTLLYRMGAGKWAEVTPRSFRTLVRSIVQAAKSHHISHLAVSFSETPFPLLHTYGDEWVARTIAENLVLASYEFTRYKTKKKPEALQEVLLCGGMSVALKKALSHGEITARAANVARDIANTSALDMNPTKLAATAKDALRGTKANVKVLGEKELKKLKMNLLLAVGQGTKDETKLIVIEYKGAGAQERPLVFVGKGITYDTGGLNVKPSGHMHDMHMDMAGGAAVIGALAAIAKAGIKRNIIGIVPAAENVVSAESMRAGDIVTAMNGMTVEILHTDAEGRLILADALTYSERFKPAAIIDVATLTGAALVALGPMASAIMGNDETLEETLRSLGEETGDLVWPLPLWDEYQQPLKSARADIANIATNFSRNNGTIEGAAFLKNFVPKDVPWTHIDIAPRMESASHDKLAKGATGEPVRLLVALAKRGLKNVK